MKKVKTNDGSITFYNDKYKDYYHSRYGAVSEAFDKYIKPCNIEEKCRNGHIRVLDIGFGLGYNAIAAIDTALSIGCEIEVISLEMDKEVIIKAAKLSPNLKNYHILKKLEYDPINNNYLYEDKNIFLKIKIGNATHTIKSINEKFDAVFLDGFDPRKNKELWSTEFFREIKKRMKQRSILATYSCARKVRENLKDAGFNVRDGPVVGRRGPCTIAD